VVSNVCLNRKQKDKIAPGHTTDIHVFAIGSYQSINDYIELHLKKNILN